MANHRVLTADSSLARTGSFPLVRPSERRREPSAPLRAAGSTRAATRGRDRTSIGGPLVMILAVGAWSFGAFGEGRPVVAAIVVVPLLYAVVSALVRKLSDAATPGHVIATIEIGFALKLFFAFFRFRSSVDSVLYDQVGAELAKSFRHLDFSVDTGRSIPGTGSVRYFTGLVHVFTGSNFAATFLAYAFIAFWGQYFFYRAAVLALPRGRTNSYLKYVMFWPSMLYWPSSIGKESLILFGLGVAVYGLARFLAHLKGALIPSVLGLAIIVMIRPHVALLTVTAAVIPLVARTRKADRGAGLVAKILALSVLVVLGAVTAHQTEERLNLDDLSGGSVAISLDRTVQQTSQGGGQFAAARVYSPADLPWAAITVLFRPFPIEAHGVPGLVASAEGLLLAALLLREAPTILRSLLGPRRVPLALFASAYTLVFVYLFSAIANFGILVRQRTQLLPIVFFLLALPLAATDRRRSRPASAGGSLP